MIKYYLLVAWRNLLRHRLFSIINVLGLSIGIGSCLVLLSFVKHERSYDSFHPDSDRVYRVIQHVDSESYWSFTGGAVAPMMKNAFGDNLDYVVSLHHTSTFISAPEGTNPAENFREDNFVYSDPHFNQVFGFKVEEGSWEGLLDQPYQLAITKNAAQKYFGEMSAVGQVLLVDKVPYEIKAVLQDLPGNTHMKFDFITGMASFKAKNFIPLTAEFNSFWWPQVYTYIKIKSGQDASAISTRIPEVNQSYRNPDEAKKYVPFLQPINSIHLDSYVESDWTPGLSEKTLWIFLSIGIFILVLAAINFVNLSTARAIKRMKEIGIRKVNGANRHQLVWQFLAEAFLINLAAVLVGVLMVYLLLPVINFSLALDIPFSLSVDKNLQILLLTVWIASSLLSGMLPALYLSGLKPEMILKSPPEGRETFGLRKVLVVFQFVLASLLVFCSAVAFYQHRFMAGASPGFETSRLMTLRLGYGNKQAEILKNELENVSGIAAVLLSSVRPGIDPGWSPSVEYAGMAAGEGVFLNVQYVDKEYFNSLGIPMAAGREFSDEFNDQGVKSMMREQFAALDGLGIVINEAAAKWMGKEPESALGSFIRVFTEENGQLFSDYKGNVVGVVQNFHTQSVKESITPTIFLPVINSAFNASTYLLVISEKTYDTTLFEALKGQWQKSGTDLPFDFNFVEEGIKAQYLQEEKTGKLLGLFALISLVISAMGLFGLSIFTAESKKKEIGIRKVLGASVNRIVHELTGGFLAPVLLSLLISMPLGYYLMAEWLNQFAYKIVISPYYFLGSASLSVGVAYFTVWYNSVKIATSNPVNALKND